MNTDIHIQASVQKQAKTIRTMSVTEYKFNITKIYNSKMLSPGKLKTYMHRFKYTYENIHTQYIHIYIYSKILDKRLG